MEHSRFQRKPSRNCARASSSLRRRLSRPGPGGAQGRPPGGQDAGHRERKESKVTLLGPLTQVQASLGPTGSETDADARTQLARSATTARKPERSTCVEFENQKRFLSIFIDISETPFRKSCVEFLHCSQAECERL